MLAVAVFVDDMVVCSWRRTEVEKLYLIAPNKEAPTNDQPPRIFQLQLCRLYAQPIASTMLPFSSDYVLVPKQSREFGKRRS